MKFKFHSCNLSFYSQCFKLSQHQSVCRPQHNKTRLLDIVIIIKCRRLRWPLCSFYCQDLSCYTLVFGVMNSVFGPAVRRLQSDSSPRRGSPPWVSSGKTGLWCRSLGTVCPCEPVNGPSLLHRWWSRRDLQLKEGRVFKSQTLWLHLVCLHTSLSDYICWQGEEFISKTQNIALWFIIFIINSSPGCNFYILQTRAAQYNVSASTSWCMFQLFKGRHEDLHGELLLTLAQLVSVMTSHPDVWWLKHIWSSKEWRCFAWFTSPIENWTELWSVCFCSASFWYNLLQKKF